MKPQFLAVATVFLAGCACRTGTVDCTTGRLYPGYCKPWAGGPLDPFPWVTGDTPDEGCCVRKCGYTPYGGQMPCGETMGYTPSCVSPPLRWADPAVPSAPVGHIVHGSPTTAPPPSPDEATTPDSSPDSPPPLPPAPKAEPDAASSETTPPFLNDARRDEPTRARL